MENFGCISLSAPIHSVTRAEWQIYSPYGFILPLGHNVFINFVLVSGVFYVLESCSATGFHPR